jgi:hypothetical protein
MCAGYKKVALAFLTMSRTIRRVLAALAPVRAISARGAVIIALNQLAVIAVLEQPSCDSAPRRSGSRCGDIPDTPRHRRGTVKS